MEGITTVVLVVLGLWTGVLTLVLVLTVRQVALLTVRFATDEENDVPVTRKESFSVADDGPPVGRQVPEEALALLPQLQSERLNVLLLSGTCAPCRKLAADLKSQRFQVPLQSPVLVLTPGPKDLVDDLVGMLPRGLETVPNPLAADVAHALQIRSTPFAVAIHDGIVVKKAYMHRAGDFISFVQDDDAAVASEIVFATQEVSHVS